MDDRKATAEPERKLLFYDATKPKAVDVPTKHPWFDSDELKKPVQSDNELRQKLEQQKKNIEALRQRGDLKLPDDGYKLDLRLAKVMSELDALRPSTSVEKVPLEKKQLEMDRVNRPKVLEQMYAEGPVMHRLYGGAMSDTRYREARAATYDAVHRLHKAVTECPEETEESPDPSGLVIPLMQHQRQALTWILWREKQVPRGGILADDMGLGKTLTMIALILMKKQLRKEGKVEHDENLDRILSREDLTPSKATLVICPASLMHQWRSEIEKRVRPGRIKIELFHGPKQKRENIPYRLARFDVVLTTYGLVASEIGEHKVPDLDGSKETYDKKGNLLKAGKSSDSVLLRVAWDRIILDEAHTIKNHTTLTAKACCRIPAGSRWCLSGTPIHNDLMDFYSLLRFLRCAPFDEKKVWKEYIQDSKSSA